MSPFKAIYGREPLVPSSILPLLETYNPESPEVAMRLIANELFRLQASASQSLSLTTTKESSKANAHCPELPSFSPGDRVMFYHHRPGGRSHKLATTWSGPYCVVHQQFQEYSIASEDTGVVVNRVHGCFLQRYLTPWQETEGGIVKIPADLWQVAPSS